MANPYSAARSSAGEWHPCFGSAPGRRGQAWAGRGSWADVEVHERLTQVPAVEMHGRPPRPTCQRLLQLHRTVLEVHRTIGRRRPICKYYKAKWSSLISKALTARQRRIHPSLPERMSRRAVLAWTYPYGCSFFYEPSVPVRARATFGPVRAGCTHEPI